MARIISIVDAVGMVLKPRKMDQYAMAEFDLAARFPSFIHSRVPVSQEDLPDCRIFLVNQQSDMNPSQKGELPMWYKNTLDAQLVRAEKEEFYARQAQQRTDRSLSRRVYA